MRLIATFLIGFATLFLNQAFAYTPTCKDFNIMNENQKQVMRDAYDFGKPYGYEWILPAQAWKESSLGEELYLDDIRGGSHGIYQNLLDNVLWREFEVRLNPKPNERRAQTWHIEWTKYMLNTHHWFAAKHAVLELQFWKARSKTEWSMLAAYNGGWSALKFKNGKPVNKTAHRYAAKIQRYKALMRDCKNSPLYGR